MKILVVGASQGTGALCVQSALAKGHAVRAFSRSPAKLNITHSSLKKIAGDFHDAASMKRAVAGHDAVMISAAPKPSAIKDTPDYFSHGTKYCIEAMKEHGVKRLVVLTSFGTGDSESVAGWFMKTFFIHGLLKGFYRDHGVQERITRESGLEFVFARPTRLTNGPAKGEYVRTEKLISVPSSIARADLADFMVEVCESLGKAIHLGG
jgi:putative NADH-flavin reductase